MNRKRAIGAVALASIIILSVGLASTSVGAVDASLNTKKGTVPQGSTLIVFAEADIQSSENVPVDSFTFDLGNGNTIEFDVDGNIIGNSPQWVNSVTRTDYNAGYGYGYGSNFGYGYGYGYGSGVSPTFRYKVSINTEYLQQQSYTSTFQVNTQSTSFNSQTTTLTVEQPGKASGKTDKSGKLDLDLGLAKISKIQFENLQSGQDVQVQTSSNPSGGAPQISDRNVATYVDIEVVGQSAGSSTVSMTLAKSALNGQGISPSEGRIAHYNNGQWSTLSTTFTDNNDGTVTLTATTSGYSPFAVVGDTKSSGGGGAGDGVIDYSQITTATPAVTDTADSTATSEPTSTPESTQSGTDTTTEEEQQSESSTEVSESEPSSTGQQTTSETTPGFGALLTAIALLGATLLAIRRSGE